MAQAGAKHANELDIELAYRTLVVLGTLAEKSLLPPKTDIRSLAANLCLYQDHWATPIFNPMLGRKEFDKPLPTPRPLATLERLNCVVPVSAEDLATTHEGEAVPWKGVVEEGARKYVVVGGKVWKQLVESGKITGEGAKAADVTAFNWLKDLFDVFYTLGQVEGDQTEESDDKGKGKGKGTSSAKGKGKGKGKDTEKEEKEEKEEGEELGTVDQLKETARNLAACWYYTATEVDFDEEEGSDDEDDEEGEESEEGDEDEDEGEDEDEDEDEGEEEDEEEEAEKEEKKEEQKEEKKETTEASTAERSPKRHKPETPTKEGGSSKKEEPSPGSSSGKVTFKDLPASLEDDDEDYDEEDDEEFDPDAVVDDEDDEYIEEDDLEAEEEESQSTKQIREAIMQGVESLGAYIPNPETDPVFFKRMVVKMRTVGNEAPEEYAQLWFPLGTDPTIFLNIQK